MEELKIIGYLDKTKLNVISINTDFSNNTIELLKQVTNQNKDYSLMFVQRDFINTIESWDIDELNRLKDKIISYISKKTNP
jgi:hypothetical protein